LTPRCEAKDRIQAHKTIPTLSNTSQYKPSDQIIMRVHVLLALATAVAARRAPPAMPANPSRRVILDHWGYPYGWGLDDPELPEPHEEPMKKVKEVKRGTFMYFDAAKVIVRFRTR
jgi:hypothetical protein